MKLQCSIDMVKTLTPIQVKEILDRDKEGEFLLLDVRQPQEYVSGHISGAMLIPLGELEIRHAELNRGKKIITYCRSGKRGNAAAIALCGLGFQHIYTIDGGIMNWTYPTIKGAPESKPVLISSVDTVADILMLAVKMENGAAYFYREAAPSIKSPTAKDLFLKLAIVEDSHMERLYQRAADIIGQSSVPSLDQLKNRKSMSHIEGGIEINQALASIGERVSDELDALEIAIEKEYMSYDLYRRAASQVTDPDTRKLLNQLALDERAHANELLERLSDIVAQ